MAGSAAQEEEVAHSLSQGPFLSNSVPNAPTASLKVALGNSPNLPYMIDVDQYEQNNGMFQGDNSNILTPALCRAARGFLDWTQTDLAGHSGVSRSTIRDYEGARHDVHRATRAQLCLAFERKGLSFLSIDGDRVALSARVITGEAE